MSDRHRVQFVIVNGTMDATIHCPRGDDPECPCFGLAAAMPWEYVEGEVRVVVAAALTDEWTLALTGPGRVEVVGDE